MQVSLRGASLYKQPNLETAVVNRRPWFRDPRNTKERRGGTGRNTQTGGLDTVSLRCGGNTWADTAI